MIYKIFMDILLKLKLIKSEDILLTENEFLEQMQKLVPCKQWKLQDAISPKQIHKKNKCYKKKKPLNSHIKNNLHSIKTLMIQLPSVFFGFTEILCHLLFSSNFCKFKMHNIVANTDIIL